MKILLLGAAGFIGTNLTIELAKKTEDEITLVDRSKAFFKPIVGIKNIFSFAAFLYIKIWETKHNGIALDSGVNKIIRIMRFLKFRHGLFMNGISAKG